ncbi:unnamed protein product [Linum trigynum]|uniref:Uncharacterized protein n=1 Tax=Linum trigynum TaxID=586398 RepID=A0AAV2G9R5_9ROSI
MAEERDRNADGGEREKEKGDDVDGERDGGGATLEEREATALESEKVDLVASSENRGEKETMVEETERASARWRRERRCGDGEREVATVVERVSGGGGGKRVDDDNNGGERGKNNDL